MKTPRFFKKDPVEEPVAEEKKKDPRGRKPYEEEKKLFIISFGIPREDVAILERRDRRTSVHLICKKIVTDDIDNNEKKEEAK